MGDLVTDAAMLAGLGLAYVYYIAAPALPTIGAFRPLYLFLLNKIVTSTKLCVAVFVRPACGSAACSEGGDGGMLDGVWA